jgi:hypothetical protein
MRRQRTFEIANYEITLGKQWSDSAGHGPGAALLCQLVVSAVKGEIADCGNPEPIGHAHLRIAALLAYSIQRSSFDSAIGVPFIVVPPFHHASCPYIPVF